ncbi:MAG: DUF2934 domain-containing protein [Betaproteobacteria bacterium]
MAKKAVLSSKEISDDSHHTEVAHIEPVDDQHAIDLANYQELVSKAAYFIAEHRNFVPGNEMGDWLKAEADIFGLAY